MLKAEKEKILELGYKNLKGNDLEFFTRVWNSNFKNYSSRIQAIDFVKDKKVLDAGCGMGQWTIPLSSVNKEVVAIDISEERIKLVCKIANLLNIKNIKCEIGNLETLDFEDNYFDSIFCYSVIYFTNFTKSIEEFYRVLKPNGKLYLVSNGLGWYVNNILNEINRSENYNPKNISIDSIQNTIDYFANGKYNMGKQIIISSEIMKKSLINAGFKDIIVDSEGGINLTKNEFSQSFYKLPSYGVENIYEILATK